MCILGGWFHCWHPVEATNSSTKAELNNLWEYQESSNTVPLFVPVWDTRGDDPSGLVRLHSPVHVSSTRMHKIRLSANSLGLLRVQMGISLFLRTAEVVSNTHYYTAMWGHAQQLPIDRLCRSALLSGGQAPHRIIPHVTWQFASEYSLLCVPYFYNYALMVVNPLPRQHIHLIKSLKIQSADPLTRKQRSSLLRKPCSTMFPLLPDPVYIWSLVRIFIFRILVEKEAPVERLVWKSCSMLGPDSLLDHGPVGLDLLPDMTCL